MTGDAKPYTAAIFDLDGVIVDTAEFHFLAWKSIADELGLPFDRRKNERLRGVPRMRSLEIVLEDMARKPSDPGELAERKNQRYVEMIQSLKPSDLCPGAEELLTALADAGIRVGLASSSKNARAVIERLGIAQRFGAVVDGHGFEKAKPDPEIFLNCGRLLGVAPGQSVVVEDAAAGIVAAKAAGMYAVGIARDEPLTDADICVKQLNEIPTSLWGI